MVLGQGILLALSIGDRFMNDHRITLREAIKFHGHLGPYLILGILAGEFALKKLKTKKYFGLRVNVWGANRKPQSCFIDGLQLSTGATYGKGNIKKLNGSLIKVRFRNCANNRKIALEFKDSLIKKLNQARTHRESELLAKKFYKIGCSGLFDLNS